MNKINVIIKKSESKKIDDFLKNEDIKKIFRIVGKNNVKYEFLITENKTSEIIEKLKKLMNGFGFINMDSTNLIYPNITGESKKKDVEELILKGAKNFTVFDKNYVLFTVCAAIIACIGFQVDSIIALVSAMIICPLMAPIMASSYALANSIKKLIIRGFRVEIAGIALIIIASMMMSLFPNPSLVLEKSVASINLIYSFLIAVVVGIVSANAFITGKYEALTGAAVGISLLPPITNAVILFASAQMPYAIASMLSFVANLAGMHLSSAIFFSMNKEK
ncbi:MAG: TIGR00341 family protein [Candidatus Nanoarchaeia archaeon]|nr:TIGR00341 family protein [Candidatus Nanoarchaeia archaeon]MDD5054055.1 TIGR00341 family protein [Candidatus Nanoarchaeia archaeon]